MLLFNHDEIIKNLISLSLERSNIKFKNVATFKHFVQELKTKEYKACFIDIDLQVNTECLEKFVSILNKLKTDDESFKSSQVYCIYCKISIVISFSPGYRQIKD